MNLSTLIMLFCLPNETPFVVKQWKTKRKSILQLSIESGVVATYNAMNSFPTEFVGPLRPWEGWYSKNFLFPTILPPKIVLGPKEEK